MSKKILLIPLLAITLTGCSFFNFTNEKHEPGLFSNGSKVDENTSGPRALSYINGNSLDKNGLTTHVITFKNDQTSVELKTTDEIENYTIDSDSSISQIASFSNVAKNPQGLRVGDASTSKDGSYNIKTSFAFIAVSIEAVPYNSYVVDFERNVFVADDDVAIDVNNKGFIKLDSTVKSEKVVTTTCNFKFESNISNLNLTVAHKRAIIQKITFYL